jgi:hypothetical protein
MAVGIDSVTVASVDTNTTVSGTLVASATVTMPEILVINAINSSITRAVTATYGGITQQDSDAIYHDKSAGNIDFHVFAFLNPPLGSQSWQTVCAISTTQATAVYMLKAANQGAKPPAGDMVLSDTNITISNFGPGDLLIDQWVYSTTSTDVPGAGQVLDYESLQSSAVIYFTGSHKPGALGNGAMTWGSADGKGHLGLRIKPPIAGSQVIWMWSKRFEENWDRMKSGLYLPQRGLVTI